MELFLNNYISLKNIKKYYEARQFRRISPYLLEYANSLLYKKLFTTCDLQIFHSGVNRNRRSYAKSLFDSEKFLNVGKSKLERVKDEYRKFIEENKYGRIKFGNRPISIPRIQCSKSNRNSVKYASRRFLNDLGK